MRKFMVWKRVLRLPPLLPAPAIASNALLGADVCLYRIAFALFTEFTACLCLLTSFTSAHWDFREQKC